MILETRKLCRNGREALARLLPCCEELYLAIENAGLPGTEKRNRLLAELAASRGSRCLQPNVHYTLPGDDIIYRMLNCIRTGKPLAGAAHFPARHWLLPAAAGGNGGALPLTRRLRNTLRVAESCSFVLQRKECTCQSLFSRARRRSRCCSASAGKAWRTKGCSMPGICGGWKVSCPSFLPKGWLPIFDCPGPGGKARREGIPLAPAAVPPAGAWWLTCWVLQGWILCATACTLSAFSAPTGKVSPT